MKLLPALLLLLSSTANAAVDKTFMCIGPNNLNLRMASVTSVEFKGNGNYIIEGPKGTAYLSIGKSVCQLVDSAALPALPSLPQAPPQPAPIDLRQATHTYVE